MGNETKEEERTASDRAREADERFVQRLREALGDFLDTDHGGPSETYNGNFEGDMLLEDLSYAPDAGQPGTPVMCVRAYNRLRRARCESLSDVLDLVEWDLLPGVRQLNQSSADNAIDVCRHYCPEETEKRMEAARSSRERRLRLQEESKKLILSESRQDLPDKPIEELIPRQYLDTSVLGHLDLKTFRELCAILANGGDYDVAEYGTGNIYTENVEIGLVQVLRICENILTA